MFDTKFGKIMYALLYAQVKINNTSQIDGIIDDIMYNKGASILQMLQIYLGLERFQVSNFLFLLLVHFTS